MDKFRKKRIIIPMVLVFFCGFMTQAQEPEEKPPEATIFCAELDLEVDNFEAIEPSIVRVCCGGPFQEATIPCKIISKASYESFTGQSDEEFSAIKQGILVNQLLESKKDELSKIKTMEVISSSIVSWDYQVKVTVKKGTYPIDVDGKVWLEVEFLK